MIEIKDKSGKSLFKTDKNPKDLFISYTGNLQNITLFELDEDEDPIININKSLLEIFYKYYW